MKNYIIKNSIFALLILTFASCTDVINVTVPNAGARLVVEASINWEKGTTGSTQTIKLSTSTAYFDKNTDKPATGAKVTVTKKDTGTQFIFADQNNGMYTTTNFVPEVNASYDLSIIYKGKTYVATETLVGVVPIKKVEQEVRSDFGGGQQVRVKTFYDDPVNETNYYLAEFQQGNFPLTSLKVRNDQFTNGNESFIGYYHDDENETKVKINIKLYGISKRFHNYIEQLLLQSGAEGRRGGPFETTPAQLKGNCKNINDPNEEVLGYFRLSEFSKVSYTVK